MIFIESITEGVLVRRYKRFFAEVDSSQGLLLSHCANTGSMRSLLHEGQKAWVSHVDDPKRKLKYTLQALQLPNGAWACVNTHLPNRLVFEAIEEGIIPELVGYSSSKREVKYGSENSKIDILLQREDQLCYVEIKNATMMDELPNGRVQFPDSVTTRGQKHLRELAEMVEQGHRAVLFFLANRTDAQSFSVADHIDEEYARLLAEVMAKGVEVLIYNTQMILNESTMALTLGNKISYES